MASKKACKNCKFIVEKGSNTCPACNSHQFSENVKGRMYVLNPEKSVIGKKMEVKKEGEYAIKVR